MGYASWSVVFGEQPSAAKWNILGTNDSSFNDGTGIAAGKILPNHLLAAASSLNTWVWDSWTPSWTNFTVGNATQTGKFIQIGKTVIASLSLDLGTTSSMGTAPVGTLPVTAAGTGVYPAADLTVIPIGSAIIHDASAAVYDAVPYLNSTTAFGIYCKGQTLTNINLTGITSTVPMTWTSTDKIEALLIYQAA